MTKGVQGKKNEKSIDKKINNERVCQETKKFEQIVRYRDSLVEECILTRHKYDEILQKEMYFEGLFDSVVGEFQLKCIELEIQRDKYKLCISISKSNPTLTQGEVLDQAHRQLSERIKNYEALKIQTAIAKLNIEYQNQMFHNYLGSYSVSREQMWEGYGRELKERIKKYHSIYLLCHPDKTQMLEMNDKQRKELVEIYQRLTQIFQNKEANGFICYWHLNSALKRIIKCYKEAGLEVPDIDLDSELILGEKTSDKINFLQFEVKCLLEEIGYTKSLIKDLLDPEPDETEKQFRKKKRSIAKNRNAMEKMVEDLKAEIKILQQEVENYRKAFHQLFE